MATPLFGLIEVSSNEEVSLEDIHYSEMTMMSASHDLDQMDRVVCGLSALETTLESVSELSGDAATIASAAYQAVMNMPSEVIVGDRSYRLPPNPMSLEADDDKKKGFGQRAKEVMQAALKRLVEFFKSAYKFVTENSNRIRNNFRNLDKQLGEVKDMNGGRGELVIPKSYMQRIGYKGATKLSDLTGAYKNFVDSMSKPMEHAGDINGQLADAIKASGDKEKALSDFAGKISNALAGINPKYPFPGNRKLVIEEFSQTPFGQSLMKIPGAQRYVSGKKIVTRIERENDEIGELKLTDTPGHKELNDIYASLITRHMQLQDKMVSAAGGNRQLDLNVEGFDGLDDKMKAQHEVIRSLTTSPITRVAAAISSEGTTILGQWVSLLNFMIDGLKKYNAANAK